MVFQANFDGFVDSNGSGTANQGESITGIVGGSATIVGTSTTVTSASPLFLGGYLSSFSGDANQGAFIVPSSPANSLGVLVQKASGQTVLKGGMDIFIRSGVPVTSSDPAYQILVLAPNGGPDNLELLMNNQNGTAFRVAITNRAAISAGGLVLAAPPSFVIEANKVYHFGVIYENDGAAGNSTGYLFGIQGNGPIDTTNRTASNPAFLGSATVNFTNTTSSGVEPGGLTFSGFSFGRLNSRSDNDLQEWDSFRIYDTAPTLFPGIAVTLPSVEIEVAAGVAEVRFTSELSRSYRVQMKDDLNSTAAWQTLSDNIPGTGGIVEVTDPNASVAQRFYRVQVLP